MVIKLIYDKYPDLNAKYQSWMICSLIYTVEVFSVFIMYRICHLECHFITIVSVCDGCHARGRQRLLNTEHLFVLSVGCVVNIIFWFCRLFKFFLLWMCPFVSTVLFGCQQDDLAFDLIWNLLLLFSGIMLSIRLFSGARLRARLFFTKSLYNTHYQLSV